MYSIREISLAEAPPLLRHIPDPPDRLFVAGSLPREYIYLTIVGSRKYTDYGKQACESLIAGLRGLPVVIVSGLALGIDSIAHQAALANGLLTVAIPGSGLSEEALYPPTHRGLALEIIDRGGALISPFENDTVGAPWTFPNRNRIMAGISTATLVIEADIKSGTLITSKYACDFNRDVFAVPGSIFSKQSDGPHQLIRSGATPITCAADLREALGFEREAVPKTMPLMENLSSAERIIIEALSVPLSHDELFEKISSTGMTIDEMSAGISLLEIQGVIIERLGKLTIL